MAAQHSALWGFDRWYRLWWYIWPASCALLISGWICIDKPAGLTRSGGSPSSSSGTWTAPLGKDIKPAIPAQPDWVPGEMAKCFSDQGVTGPAMVSCTALISSGRLTGNRLAAVLTQRGFVQRAHPDEAIKDYNAALKVQPGFAEALENRAWIYMTRGGYDAAVSDLNTAISSSPQNPGIARYYRGYAFFKLNKYPEALADLNEAQRLQPNNSDIYLARGDVEQALENYDAALRDFDEFSKRAPKDVRGPNSRGSVLEAMGRSPEALTAFESALALEPGNTYALDERDRLRAEQNEGNQPK
jgi:tetratricopeptide (TPR) repeat protein